MIVQAISEFSIKNLDHDIAFYFNNFFDKAFLFENNNELEVMLFNFSVDQNLKIMLSNVYCLSVFSLNKM